MSDNESEIEEYDSDNEFGNTNKITNKITSKPNSKKNDYGGDIEDEENDEETEEVGENDEETKEVGDEDLDEAEDDDDDYYDDDETDDDDEAGGPDSDSEEENDKKKSKSKVDKSKKPISNNLDNYGDGDDDDDDDDDEKYLQKFDNDINNNYIVDNHPECLYHNYDEITSLSRIVRDIDNIIIDPLHKTIPFLTKYERARILGQRAKQIESGAKPLVKVPENIIDGYIIAELELREKKIPFVIKRPLPDGSCEYWSVKDLELIIY